MTGSSEHQAGWRRKWLSLLLSFALAVNLIGPSLAGLPQKDGYVPICTGGEIIYIPLGSVGPPEPSDDAPEPVSERCPWFAQFHATEVEPFAAGHGAVVYATLRFRPADRTVAGQPSSRSFQARAPPYSGA